MVPASNTLNSNGNGVNSASMNVSEKSNMGSERFMASDKASKAMSQKEGTLEDESLKTFLEEQVILLIHY